MNNNNTCLYQTYARFVDPDNYIGEIKINISNKDICYNVDRFEDLKDIMDMQQLKLNIIIVYL